MRTAFVVLAVLVLACSGCPTGPTPIPTPPAIPTSEQVGAATTAVTAARADIQGAGTTIKGEVKGAGFSKSYVPALAAIDVAADKVLEGAAVIQKQEASLVVAGQQAGADENHIAELRKMVAARDKTIADVTADANVAWRNFAMLAVAVAGVGAGIGFVLGNMRLSVAAALAGGVAAVLATILGVVYAYRGWILLAIAVGAAAGAAIVIIGVAKDWWKNPLSLNALREVDKPTTPTTGATP